MRDLNKCILCGKCIEICNEILQSHTINFGYRSSQVKIIADEDVDLRLSQCLSCGLCVAVCPVGALTDKAAQGKGRTWEFKKVKTICNYCGCGCNFDFNIKDGKVVKVTSNPESIVNGIHLCVKGRFGYDYIHREDRLKTPLIRKNGKLEKASWEEAFQLISDKFLIFQPFSNNHIH
ncbi:unnamed protein product [marine sediment metagenome]|uniref:4Fe-4S ferredoxin-type domain-containing protein n=1 Tax=marine sediment metagenome TaxID=412755 RepID=X1RLZ5_9ZZZZ